MIYDPNHVRQVLRGFAAGMFDEEVAYETIENATKGNVYDK